MLRARKLRFIEPQGRQGRPFNAWIRRWPLLGPITLATILHERGYDVGVYNENISGPLPDNERAYEDVCSADVVGISIMTPTAARGYVLADRIRKDAPAATIVFGGVHASFLPNEAIQHGDIVVCGEGENAIEAIARGDVARGIVRPAAPPDLDVIPALNHFLVRDFEKLLAGYRTRSLYELPVATSRGCPYGCTYCSVTRMFGRKVRRQSVAKAYQDLRYYAGQGFRHFFFYDDNFTTDRTWTRQLLERLRPMRMRFNAQARADFHWADSARRRLDEPLLRAMRRAGGDILYIGYETIDDATARQWRKGYRGRNDLRARLGEDTRILHDNGFWIHGMFVLGPEHTARTADRIVEFGRSSEIETIQISVLTPFPGTPLFDQMRPHLIFTDYPGDWDYYDGTHCVYGHGRMDVAQVQRTVLQAHRNFYRWGGWSLRRIRAMIKQKMGLADRLSLLWANARTARTTLRQWRDEVKAFLEVVRERKGRYTAQLGFPGR